MAVYETYTNDLNYVGPWFQERVPTLRNLNGKTALGLIRQGKLVAGVLYENYNGCNIFAHWATEPGTFRPLTANFLWAAFHYPFEVLGCRRVSGLVEPSNSTAVKMDLKLGFHVEATLKNAAPSGDLLLMCMLKEDCKWLKRDPARAVS